MAIAMDVEFGVGGVTYVGDISDLRGVADFFCVGGERDMEYADGA